MLDLAKAHRREEVRSVRARQVRGSLRIRADRPDQQEAQRRSPDREIHAKTGGNVNQSDGCAEAQPRQRATVCSARQGKGQEAAQGRRRPAANAAADLRQRQARRQGRAEEDGEAGARAAHRRRPDSTAFTAAPGLRCPGPRVRPAMAASIPQLPPSPSPQSNPPVSPSDDPRLPNASWIARVATASTAANTAAGVACQGEALRPPVSEQKIPHDFAARAPLFQRRIHRGEFELSWGPMPEPW